MSSIPEIAHIFFEDCQGGKGWEGFSPYSTGEATFSAQAEPILDVNAWKQYANLVQGLHPFMPDAGYAIKSFATDEKRKAVCAYAVFSATHIGEGGPCPPTENSTSMDYVYVIEFDGDNMIRHMTKIGHSWIATKGLDWVTQNVNMQAAVP